MHRGRVALCSPAQPARRASIIFVTHHLEEILEITDRVYVFKDGKNVAEMETKG